MCPTYRSWLASSTRQNRNVVVSFPVRQWLLFANRYDSVFHCQVRASACHCLFGATGCGTAHFTTTSTSATLPPALTSTAVVASLSVCTWHTSVMVWANVHSTMMRTFVILPVPTPVSAVVTPTCADTLSPCPSTQSSVSCTPMAVGYNLLTWHPTPCWFIST